ncbi:ComEA family DNA-binding protein [Yersinia massiliensis]|uniref:ComEA family DNA-binding protein n=1 Tax=Yersinia massiliensis TaxID=419257 RepID=UPI000308A29C|nr:ComEA family DNA-binding protein [Yersinia massiliensis]
MKFIGKLFVITALLVGANLQQLAHAAPLGSNNPAQDKALNQPNDAKKVNQAIAGQAPLKTVSKESGLPNTSAVSPADNLSGGSQGQANINSDNAEQLAKKLSGIGKKKADAIIHYREQFGPFTDVEQLLEVPGIGPSFIERNGGKLKL